MHDILPGLAENKEWGLIVLIFAAFGLLTKYLAKSVADQQKANLAREERLTQTLVAFSDSIPKLIAAIDSLRSWLEERFSDVGGELGTIRGRHDQVVLKVEDHEGRITGLERAGARRTVKRK